MTRYYYTYLVYLTNPNSSLYGKIYYGKHVTSNINDGYIGSGKILSQYIKKYPNDYYRKILHLYNSREELNKAEYDLIHQHFGKWYCINLKEGGVGGGCFGSHRSEETKKKMSKSQKGRIISEEHKHKISMSLKGHKVSEETKQAVINSRLGKHLSEETKHKISDTLKGYKYSEERNKKISKSLKGHIPPNKGKQFNKNTRHYE